MELDGKVLVLRRIHLVLELKGAEANRETAERVHGFYADNCPLYRSLKPALAITSELAFVPE